MSSTIIASGGETPLLAPERRAELLRLGMLATALAIGLVPTYQYVGSMVWFHEYLGDYNVFWGIGSAPLNWVYGHFRPVFPYSPPALILIRPFGLLPFWPSFLAWSVIGVTAMSLAARRIIGPKAIALGFTTAAAIAVLACGQISLFIGALIIGGLSTANPRWRGALLAVAAVIKPQSLLAAPVALIAERNLRAIGWAIIASCALLLASVVLFGVETWVRWANEIPVWRSFVVAHGIDRNDIGVYGMLRSFGLPGWTYAIGVPLGIATSWLAFRREARLVDRYAAFVCATVLMSPYTLSYDLAGLSLACVAMLLDKDRSPLIWLAAALVVSLAFANIGIVMMALVLSYEALRVPCSPVPRTGCPSTSRTSSSAASPR
jgi:hypothetical protein